jgi:biopolymer transport protein ExbD
MAVRINKGSSMPQLPVVPLVDTVLNLLIFFLVATRFAAADRELEVKLPEAAAAKPLVTKVAPLALNIDAEGQYFLAGQKADLTTLRNALKAAEVNNPGRVSVLIAADARCRWQHVVAAMDACTSARISDYHVTTGEGGGGKADE